MKRRDASVRFVIAISWTIFFTPTSLILKRSPSMSMQPPTAGIANEQLWSGTPGPEVLAFAQVLNSALRKIVAIKGNQATVYRGYNVSDVGAFGGEYVKNEIVTFPAFTSASFSATGAFGGNILFIIRALSARAIWWLSPNFHEEEALLPTDCRFRVVDNGFQSVEGEHRLVIVLQEISKRL